MENINKKIHAYREATRHLWNATFSSLEESERFGTGLDLFQQIDSLLFSALVSNPLELKHAARSSLEPFAELKVVPRSLSDIPILINRSTPATGYWDDPLKNIHSGAAKFALIGFFDWDEYSVKDCQYYRVRITHCDSNSTLVGRDALIETFYADVFFSKTP